MTKDPANHTVPDPLLRRAARESDVDPSGACLAPDVLAAWADRVLTAREVQAVETHAAECGRCRALLAAMVRSEPAPAPRPAWWKAPVLRWAAPLAAVGGALLVWIAVDRQPDLPLDLRAPAATTADKKAGPEQRAAAIQEAEAPKASRQAPSKAAVPQGPARSAAGRRSEPSPQARLKANAAPTAPAAPPAPAAQPATESRFAPDTARLDALAVRPEILSPDPSSRWRIGAPGTIGRSTDGGRTWEAQAVNTNARLVAGASPAPVVCWIVGAAGTVLKTTDGRTWQHLPAPDPSDLLTVTAKDANAATVTTLDGRSFSTTDGGLTWSGVPLQENPAAPFKG